MNPANIVLTVALLSAVGVTPVMAECQIADAKLEEAILRTARACATCAAYETLPLRSGPTGVMPIASASWPTSAN